MEVDALMVLEPQLANVPIQALRPSARKKISHYLDNENDVSFNDMGLLQDWHGLAELIGFTRLEMAKMENAKRPTQELLNDWEMQNTSAVLGDFWNFMIRLNRPDILTDCRAIIEHDARHHIECSERLNNDYLQLQDTTISSSGDTYIDERVLITIDDTPDCPIFYDAFMCYNADVPGPVTDFVNECITNLERTHGLKLHVCIPIRDCLLGGAKYHMDAELIKARCKRMVFVVSLDFFDSAACDFQVKFAHSLAPGSRKKRRIPVLLEDQLRIPDILKHVTLCDYTKPDLLEWFWDRLASSIKAPIDESHDGRHLSRFDSQRRSSCMSSGSVDFDLSTSGVECSDEIKSVHFQSTNLLSSAARLHTYESFSEMQMQKKSQYLKPGHFLSRIHNFVKSKRHVEY